LLRGEWPASLVDGPTSFQFALESDSQRAALAPSSSHSTAARCPSSSAAVSQPAAMPVLPSSSSGGNAGHAPDALQGLVPTATAPASPVAQQSEVDLPSSVLSVSDHSVSSAVPGLSSSGAVGSASDIGASDFEAEAFRLTREAWGVFRFSMKNSTKAPPHGCIQATCPFHARSSKTGCKKTLSIPGPTVAAVKLVFKQLWQWCNCAQQFDRRRKHIRFQMQVALLPCDEALLAQQVRSGPAGRVFTDEEMDDQLTLAAVVAGEGLPPAGPRGGRGRGRVSRGRGRGVGAASSSGVVQSQVMSSSSIKGASSSNSSSSSSNSSAASSSSSSGSTGGSGAATSDDSDSD
jgi:hypothetical protein